MKVIVEYDKYNTNIAKASIPTGEDNARFILELNEVGNKMRLSATEVLGELTEEYASIELTQANVVELSRLFSQVARGIDPNAKPAPTPELPEETE